MQCLSIELVPSIATDTELIGLNDLKRRLPWRRGLLCQPGGNCRSKMVRVLTCRRRCGDTDDPAVLQALAASLLGKS